ncbi:putative WRKY transcription factor 51-like [Capsicum annuum]|uniref:uncharacterized protein LOC107855595 n=1 Tax=Capsicum annuum TaxID=4072 RepID=UPI0007BFCF08|nr:uncharacterized protein LOC107855595 [Capsicum annuum]KAF3638430.1 putative WRKY transcription factor 51-like [Capsicum annuum]KAF3639930.1 putative WRKY transcription factor 51-like [Capsicum annuum]
MGEIEEASTGSDEASPLLPNPKPDPVPPTRTKSVRTKVPEVKVHLYKQGKGPIDEFTSSLGGWDQDQLEVRDILDKYGFKSVYAFKPDSGRGLPIRFNPLNGRSILTYRDGSEIYIDGEPKDSLIQPITKILVGVALITILIVMVMKESPEWAKKFNLGGGSNIPPWVLAAAVILFTRVRKRTKDFFGKRP